MIRDSAARVAEEIETLGAAVETVRADVGVEAEVDALMSRAVERFDRLDILVNNAAVRGGGAPLLELPTYAWVETQRVNVLGVFLCTQRAARVMIRQGNGVIVNIGSIAPMIVYPNISDYNASRARCTRSRRRPRENWDNTASE